MKRAHSVWPERQGISKGFFEHWDNATQRLETDTLKLEVIQGDARQTLPNWNTKADAWFLDGFSPAKNPELWGADLMRKWPATPNPAAALPPTQPQVMSDNPWQTPDLRSQG